MKKLRIYNHLNELVEEFDVFVEGTNFNWQSPTPKAVWLGSIVLEEASEEAQVPEKVEQIYERTDKIEELLEVHREPETINNQSAGDTWSGETKQPESVEELPEAPAGGKDTKRDKRTRQRKAA